MGCQLDSLYYPILWFWVISVFSVLIPKVLLTSSKNQYHLIADKSLISFMTLVLKEPCKFPVIWFSLPVFTEATEGGYMTYKGWVVNLSVQKKVEFIGSPDIMVIVLAHLIFVVLSAFFIIVGLAAEGDAYRAHSLTLSGKKEDDQGHDHRCNGRTKSFLRKRFVRKLLLVVCLAIYWKHFKSRLFSQLICPSLFLSLQSCRAPVQGYEMNPFLHFLIYSLFIPLLLPYAAYKTQRA
ncbi:hypothetical protein RJ641_036547 [Dillenia turbinata]|uniref:TMEM62 C-terminal domain-containing protein n=1 Tax=Dillenia turbinata TaxID=194707 RepID=A0AAN8VEP1_9MAGN